MADLPVRAVAETIVDLFVREIYGTRRKDVIRLIITEGPRFPKLAEFYYREVIARVLPAMRALLRARSSAASSDTTRSRASRSCWSRRPGRDPVERPVRPLRAARRAGADARASRPSVRRKEARHDHGVAWRSRSHWPRRFVLAGCGNGKEPTYQGWVEADLIFVGPDEAGRIETLSVREGDQVETARAAVHARRRPAAGRRRHAGSRR